MNFLVGGDQKLLLAATSVLWRGNWWFGGEFWTPTSAEILLERSLHQLFIGAIKHGGSAVKWYDKNFERSKIALLAIVFSVTQTRRYSSTPMHQQDHYKRMISSQYMPPEGWLVITTTINFHWSYKCVVTVNTKHNQWIRALLQPLMPPHPTNL